MPKNTFRYALHFSKRRSITFAPSADFDKAEVPQHRGFKECANDVRFPPCIRTLLNSEQAAALVKVHPKTLQRYARNGLVAGLRVGKLWRFRASISMAGRTHAEHTGIDSEAEQRYPVLNHSCPQPRGGNPCLFGHGISTEVYG
jgi:hypothetical protein